MELPQPELGWARMAPGSACQRAAAPPTSAAHDACLAAAMPVTPAGVAILELCMVQLEDGQVTMVGNCTGCTAATVNNATQAQLTCGAKTATTPALL